MMDQSHPQVVGGSLLFVQAMLFAQYEIALSWRAIDDYLPAIRRVSAEGIRRVASRYLTPDNRIVSMLMPLPPPQGQAPPSGASLRAARPIGGLMPYTAKLSSILSLCISGLLSLGILPRASAGHAADAAHGPARSARPAGQRGALPAICDLQQMLKDYALENRNVAAAGHSVVNMGSPVFHSDCSQLGHHRFDFGTRLK
jgi:hypothetical protein